MPSGLVAVVFSTIVFMNPIGMRLAFGTPLTVRTLVAATLGVAGVALLFLPELRRRAKADRRRSASCSALGATAIATAGNLVGGAQPATPALPMLPDDGVGHAVRRARRGAVRHGRAACRGRSTRAPAYVASLMYLAVFGSVVAFGAYLTLLKQVGAGPASYVGVSTPVIALLLSTLFEGYRWTPVAVLGVVLAIIGNVMALRPGGTRRRAPDPVPPTQKRAERSLAGGEETGSARYSKDSRASAISFFQLARSRAISAPSSAGRG